MPRLTVATSNYNFSFRDAGLRSPAWFARQILDAGFDGMEWSDVPNVHPLGLARGGLARQLARNGSILSLHQSWQSSRWSDLPEVAHRTRQEKGMKAAALAVAEQSVLIAGLPHLDGSLGKLRRVQDALGHRLPVVVHPNEQRLGDRPRQGNIDYKAIRESGDFGPLRFQITAELLAAWDTLSEDPAQTLEDMYAVMAARGEFDEIVFDSHHAYMTRGGYRLPEPAKMAGKLAADGKLAELQMCWRPDFGGEENHLKLALNGRIDETPHGAVLAEVNEKLDPDASLYLVVEARANAFAAAGVHDYLAGQRELLGIIQDSLPNLR